MEQQLNPKSDTNKLARYILVIAAIAVVLFLVWYFVDIVAYILAAAVIAVVSQPIADRLRRLRIRQHKLPAWAVALLTVLIDWGIIGLFFGLFIPLLSGKVSQLANIDLNALIGSYEAELARLEAFVRDYFSIEREEWSLSSALVGELSTLIDWTQVNNVLTSTVSFVGSAVIAIFSVTFITFYFLKEEGLFAKMIYALTPNKYIDNIRRALSSATTLLTRYFVGILCESTLIMLIVSSILLLFGFNASDAFFSGIVVGVLNVIPYVGPWIGFAICAIASVTFTAGSWSVLAVLIIVAGATATAQMIDNFVLQPMLYSKQVNAHPLEIFIVILIAGHVGGVLGMLLAIPSYNVIRVFAKEFLYNFKIVRELTDNL